jgi:palmitoyltransferase
VERFDHHCIWINNCIGSANYRLFIAMIFAALTNMLAFLGSVALLWLEGRWHMFLVGMIVNWVMFAVVAVFSLLISGLICLHLYLIYKDTTTFEYIMSKRTNQISPIRPVSNA